MFQEALEFLSAQAKATVEPRRLDIKHPRKAFFVASGGTLEVPLPVPPRQHAVEQLGEIVAPAGRFDGTDDGKPVVWYDEAAVVLVIDDDGHRVETATLTLVESDLFAVVRAMGKRSFDVRSFVRFLRIELAGALPSSELLDVVRRVKFENGTITSADVQKSRESLGRSITAAVSAEGDIPDTVTLSVPVYRTAGEREALPIRCTVEASAAENAFRLIPPPDEVENAQQMAVASIAARLAGGLPDSVPHYHGRA